MATYVFRKFNFLNGEKPYGIKVRSGICERFFIYEDEIEDFALFLSDELKRGDNGIALIGGGYIKCRLKYDIERSALKSSYIIGCALDRKKRIENMEPNFVSYVYVHNKKKERYTVCGVTNVEVQGAEVIFRFEEREENAKKEVACIEMEGYTQDNIDSVEFAANDFSFTIDNQEVVDFNLSFEENLACDMTLARVLRGGYMELCRGKKKDRQTDAFLDDKEGELSHNVEMVKINGEYVFIPQSLSNGGGNFYAKRLENGNVLIAFGKNAKTILNGRK